MTPELAPHLRPATEREIEDSIRALFLQAGWYPVKTEAGMVKRGHGLKRGHLPPGFPDLTVLRRLPGTPLCLAALIEVKTATGTLEPSQVERHAELRTLGLSPQIIRDTEAATALIAEGHRLAALLGSAQ
ncbi:VRR-NUC domain-containing protein [Deinococcus gobiensis]|uniref:Uncharacterized protein n=1 Tax=Deinococcus gobiensis (strain DSM 21396 / JCM 16679 / CGMCC 1.7299 / I-0) TaxID=745776 RepID=H8H2J9_DEIGI|nr:VRR-NUC domain-containing protein [Deinococcus gobiensis]AFD27746.1 hypothetical protein DGo_PB0477 [Deinococcus gobiensis I-0]